MQGTTNKVKSVDTATPPMIVIAMGIRVSAPGPRAKAGGIAAATVAIEVIRIGRKRTGQAVISADFTSGSLVRT